MKSSRKTADTTPRARLSRRPDADRDAGDERRAFRARGDLCVRAFDRRRHGHRRQPAGGQHQISRSAGAARSDSGGRADRAADRHAGRQGAQGRAGRNRARLRAALGRLLHRELDAADRRGHLPHRHARHPQGDRARQRAAQRHPRARLCRLGARPARAGNPAERLAALRRRSGIDLRHRHRRQIRKGAAQDRHRSRPCCRAKPATPEHSGTADYSDANGLRARGCARAGLSVSSSPAASALIGSPKAKPCAYSQPSW